MLVARCRTDVEAPFRRAAPSYSNRTAMVNQILFMPTDAAAVVAAAPGRWPIFPVFQGVDMEQHARVANRVACALCKGCWRFKDFRFLPRSGIRLA